MSPKPPFEIGENLTVFLICFSIFGVPALAVAWMIVSIIKAAAR